MPSKPPLPSSMLLSLPSHIRLPTVLASRPPQSTSSPIPPPSSFQNPSQARSSATRAGRQPTHPSIGREPLRTRRKPTASSTKQKSAARKTELRGPHPLSHSHHHPPSDSPPDGGGGTSAGTADVGSRAPPAVVARSWAPKYGLPPLNTAFYTTAAAAKPTGAPEEEKVVGVPQRYRFHVVRTPSNMLPVYQGSKAGGNLKYTMIRKVQGDSGALAEELRGWEGFSQLRDDEVVGKRRGREVEVSVNPVNGHVLLRGWLGRQCKSWLERKGF